MWVARSSFLSKLWSFSIQHQLNQHIVSWCYIENDYNFERNEDRATVFLKWTDFRRVLSRSWNESSKVEFNFESYKIYLLQSIKKINNVHVLKIIIFWHFLLLLLLYSSLLSHLKLPHFMKRASNFFLLASKLGSLTANSFSVWIWVFWHLLFSPGDL